MKCVCTLVVLALVVSVSACDVSSEFSADGAAVLLLDGGGLPLDHRLLEVHPETPIAACFDAPLSTYAPDGCLEFLERNPRFGNQRHVADDVCASPGDPVFAAGDGLVVYARAHGMCPNWGDLIGLEHRTPEGLVWVTIYGHASAIVSEGTIVRRGDLIGRVEAYPCWATHLHFGGAARAWGVPVGVYPAWLAGYIADEAPVEPYVDPQDLLADHPCSMSCTPHVDVTSPDAERAITVGGRTRVEWRADCVPATDSLRVVAVEDGGSELSPPIEAATPDHVGGRDVSIPEAWGGTSLRFCASSSTATDCSALLWVPELTVRCPTSATRGTTTTCTYAASGFPPHQRLRAVARVPGGAELVSIDGDLSVATDGEVRLGSVPFDWPDRVEICVTSHDGALVAATECASMNVISATTCAASVETCNALDDDCDGSVDEGDPGGGGSCGSAIGACRPGMLHCRGGRLECVGEVGPTTEVCGDSIDQDCNGSDTSCTSTRLRVTLDGTFSTWCPSGATIVVFDPTGFPLRSTPGAALDVPVDVDGPWSGFLMMAVECRRPGGVLYHDFNPSGRTAADAGVAEIELRGDRLERTALTCTDPHSGVGDTKVAIPGSVALRGACP